MTPAPHRAPASKGEGDHIADAGKKVPDAETVAGRLEAEADARDSQPDCYAESVTATMRLAASMLRELAGDLAEARASEAELIQACADLDIRIATAEQSRDEARAALEPFARAMFPGDWPDHQPASTIVVTVGDFRRARSSSRGEGFGSCSGSQSPAPIAGSKGEVP